MNDMRLEDRLRKAFSDSAADVEPAPIDQDLHLVVRWGQRRRRNRRLAMLCVAAALVVFGVLVAPRALDAIRGAGGTRPARPHDVRGRGIITTLVGNGDARSAGDGGPAVRASIRYPFDLVVDSGGNLYVLENGRIRKIDASGLITTVAGAPATEGAAVLTEANRLRLGRSVNALAIDAEDNLYVGGGDGRHFIVNRISPAGDVTRIAGTGRAGYSGDGGPATEAELGWVYDLAVDAVGSVYIVDHDNDLIRMVDGDGVITTIAGTGVPGWSGDGGPAVEAQVDNPWGIALDADANVYFTQMPSVVRRIDAATGVISTIAGTDKVGYAGDGGPATKARMNSPEHVSVDPQGYLLIEDTGNNCVRMVDLNGIITTIVGMRGSGFGGDGDPARLARLSEPSGMLLTTDRVLLIADSGNNRVRRVVL